MSPLLLVGITLLCTTTLTSGDVSHVISGLAQPPANPDEINDALQTKDFWWQKNDSPLKASYDYFKKCSTKGNCLTTKLTESDSEGAENGAIDLNKNVFLNGQYSQGKGGAATGFASGGSANGSASGSSGFHSGINLDLGNNPFLRPQQAHAGTGERVSTENGFLGVQPQEPFKGQPKKGFATTHPLANKPSFATSRPGSQQPGQDGDPSVCAGVGKVCVEKHLCVNGFVNKAGENLLEVRAKIQYCDIESEVCCSLPRNFDLSSRTASAANINDLAYTAGKSSVPGSTFKFTGGAGLSPGQIQILNDDSLDGRPQLNFIGESGSPSSTAKPVRDLSSAANSVFPSTVDYSNVNFDSNVRFASTIKGPAYLPPYEATTPSVSTYRPSIPTTPRPSCGPGQYLNPSGICENIQKQCPFGTRPTPSGGCEKIPPSTTPRPQCGPGQILSFSGVCTYPSTTTPRPIPRCGPGEYISPFGQCVPQVTTPPRPQCGPGQILSPSGICTYPSTTTPRPLPQCGPGEYLTSSGVCITRQTPPTRPQCAPGQIQTPFGQCTYPSTPSPSTISPSRPSCPPGSFPTAYGGCQRPTTPSPSTPGYEYPKPTTTVRPICPSGSYIGVSGNCERPVITSTPGYEYPKPCPPGTVKTSSGLCERVATPRPSCPPGSYIGDSGQCERPTVPTQKACPPGTTRTYFGSCEPLTTPRPSCPPGSYLATSGSCERLTSPSTTPGYEYPKPTCGSGEYLSPSGQCVYRTTPRPTCGPGEYLSPSGQCVYKQTTTPRPSCGPGEYLGPSGQCVYRQTTTPRPSCGPGEYLGPSGQCVYRQTTPRPSCGPGEYLSPSGQCIYRQTTTPRPSCGPGEYLSPSGQCVYRQTTTPRPSCPPGSFPTAFGGCQRPTPSPTTSGYEYPSPSTPAPRPICPSGSYIGPSGSCERPCPPGSVRSPSGDCFRQPTLPPVPTPTTSREYLPPKETSTTPRPYSPSEGYVYNTPTPTFGYPSSSPNVPEYPSSNNINQQYVPTPTTRRPRPDHTAPNNVPEGSINVPNTERYPTPPPNEGSHIESEYLTGPTKSPSTRRPPIGPGFVPQQPENNQPPSGCAAALKCVQEIYCTADGFISPVPVVLTPQQELLRAPTTTCRDVQSGIIGKCCRDANYKDPWPSANLVDGVDDGQYKEDDSISQYKGIYDETNRSSFRGRKRAVQSQSQGQGRRRTVRAAAPSCGVRNQDSQPFGRIPIDANFAEIPWQAMILKDSNRSLLCGGVIIRPNVVLTSAHCLDGQETSDVLVKGGEWKLGIDEEPLPFQIVHVAAIIRHPDYRVGSKQNDLAILVLGEKLRLTKNVGTLCLPRPNEIPTQNCIATGWGKRILQLHAKNALMHRIGVKIMDIEQCKQVINENFKEVLPHYNPNTLCGFSNIDQCKVDYGSALACADETGRYTLSGIYSWDTGCKQKGQIGGYVAPDVDWIEVTLSKPMGELQKLDRQYRNNYFSSHQQK